MPLLHAAKSNLLFCTQLQPRTIEVLKNMSPLGEQLQLQAAASFERSFWHDDGAGLKRDRRVLSVPDEIDIEDRSTWGLQQGMIEEAFLRDMDNNGLRVTRPYGFRSFTVDESADSTDPAVFPVTVELVKQEEGEKPEIVKERESIKVKTKYLIGCDGGRSAVRQFLIESHDYKMEGDFVDCLWAAGDLVLKTNFPDIRKIATIHSENNGSLYIFPRENTVDNLPLVRSYTQVDIIDGKKSTLPPWEARWKVTMKDVEDSIRRIIAPFEVEVVRDVWWSAYPIGQRLINNYEYKNRVFMAGDACHTHSPKAGQGMNTALIDSHNLAFKMNLVLRGLAHPYLLTTYNTERWKIGKQLIDFDSEYSALFSGEIPKNSPEVAKMTKEEVKAHFIQVQRRNAGFTTGAGVFYAPGPLVIPHEEITQFGAQPLQGLKLKSGERLLPATVTRCSNTQPVRLIHEVQFDSPGSFRIYVFAGKLAQSMQKLQQFSNYLTSETSFINRHRAPMPKNRQVLHAAINTGLTGYEELNPYFTVLTIVNGHKFSFNIEEFKDLRGLSAMIYADDEEEGGEKVGAARYERKVGGAHKKYGLEEGGIVVCRPDGYVAVVLPLEEAGWKALDPFFDGALFTKGEAKSNL